MVTVTLNEVAKLAGVSIKTVSRVLNNEPNVSEAMHEKVKKAISELNYVPNTSARRLSSGKSYSIGFGMGWPVNSPFTSTIIQNALKESTRLGYNMSLFSLENGSTDQLIQAYQGKQVDGFLLDTPAGKNEELRIQLNELNIPYVIIHPSSKHGHQTASFVRINDQLGAKTAVEYLLQLGHKVIGLLSFHTGIHQEKSRLTGYQKALNDAGITFNENLVYINGSHGFETGFTGFQKLLATNNAMTAVFAATDDIAMGCLAAIWQLGLKIPEDISVVGFDDIMLAEMTAPPLTTIHQPIDEIARLAVKVLVNRIDNPESSQVDLVLPTRLIVRSTCKPPKVGGVPRQAGSAQSDS